MAEFSRAQFIAGPIFLPSFVTHLQDWSLLNVNFLCIYRWAFFTFLDKETVRIDKKHRGEREGKMQTVLEQEMNLGAK